MINFSQNRNISFEKSRKQIIKDAPNKELKGLASDAMANKVSFAVRIGIADLLEYATRGEQQKKDVVNLFKDMIESEELREDPACEGYFYGYEGQEDKYPGYLKAYERLTGEKLNVVV